MRKIFSTVLVATALLFSMQANAHNVTDEADLKSKINKGNGATIDLVLTQDIYLDEPIQIYAKYNQPGETINLNLNGHTLQNNSSKNISVIELFKGTLNISNGTVKCAWSVANSCKDAIIVHGILEEKAGWSTLNIKKDAKVLSDKNAITVLEFVGIPYQYFSWADDAKAGVSCKDFTFGANAAWNAPDDFTSAFPAYRFKANVANPDKTTRYNAQTAPNGYDYRYNNSVGQVYDRTSASGKVVPSDIDYTSSFPKYSATVRESSTKGDGSYTDISARCYRKCVQYMQSAEANGVTINVEGYVYGAKYGIKVNGTIRDGSDNPLYAATVNVKDGAEVACAADAVEELGKESTAIYCSGKATWNISGYVHGNIGVVVKGGDVYIDDAVIEGTGTQNLPVTPDGSGINGGAGTGILVDSHAGYTGNQNVVISGDTRVSGGAGYAINEVIASGESQVSNISIEGGTFQQGTAGAIAFTPSTVENDVVSIGTVQVIGNTTIGEDDTDRLDELTPDYTFISEMIVGEDVVFVVSVGEAPATTEYSINASNIPASVIIKEETVTLDGDKELGYVEMPYATVVTIPAGKTLKIEKLVMGNDAQFIIMPGAKLFITGESGIVSGNVNNIVIKADENGMGTFLFNPDVVSNRNPFATVEYVCKGYTYPGTDYKLWDIFSSPFSTITSIAGQGGGSSYFQYWNGSAWTNCTSVQDIYDNAKPFKAFAISNSLNAPGKIYTFKGQLQGNNTGQFKIEKGFNYVGNGYTASLKTQQIITKVKAASAGVKTIIYVWNAEQQRWDYYNESNLSELENVESMRAFVLYSTADDDVVVDMDYETMVWDINQ